MSRDIVNETIMVNKFNEESARKFREQVLAKASLDPSMPITVYIDSYGGFVDALNSMLATMRQVPNQFVTVCIGKAMSCGAVLLAAGDFRFIDESARAMIHQGSSGTQGPIEGLQNDVNEVKRLNKQMMGFILERCSKTHKDFQNALAAKQTDDNDDARDLYLNAEESLAFGLVDFIGMPLIKPVVMYSIESAPQKEYTDVGGLLQEEAPVKKKTKKKTSKKKTTKKKVSKRSK